MQKSDVYGHDTTTMDFLSSDGEWDIFGFGPSHSCHRCLAPVGGLFLVFEHRPSGLTVSTPCIQNDASFEIVTPSGDVYLFGHIEDLVVQGRQIANVQLPSKTTFGANLRWFVDHPEAKAREALFGNHEAPIH
jgi:hypothetical protein